jgi:metallo-beta-lactamase family protein
MGYRAMAPYSGTTFDLLSGSFTRVPEPRPIEKKSGASKANAVFSRLITACERLLRAAKKLEGHANKELASFADQVTKLAEKMEK